MHIVKYKIIKYSLRWITAWAGLLDSLIAVLSFSTIYTRFEFRAIQRQVKFSMNYLGVYKNDCS